MSTDEHRFRELMRASRCAALFILLLAVVVAPWAHAATSNSDWQALEEHWYTIEIAGSYAGWSKTVISRREQKYRTLTRTEMLVRRGETPVEIITSEAFVERADGTPIRMKRIESTGDGEIRHEWRFTPDGVTRTVRQFGRETKRELAPPEGVWLTPRAATAFLNRRRAAGARDITYRTITPDRGTNPITVTIRFLRDDAYEFGGRTLPVTVWRSEFDAMPIVVIEHVSTDGLTLKQEVELGASRMVMRRETRENIERWIAERDADDAPELLVSNLIAPDRPIERVGASSRAVLRVRRPDGNRPSLPEAGAQRVRDDANDDRAAIVTIDVDNPVAASLDDAQRTAYLAPSSMIDFDDEKVRDLARIDGREEIKPMELVRQLQRRVHRHIAVKTLDTAFASASEAARTRRGDCTEHAVLLAALLRANDIPSRIATGLVYADHVEGRDHVFGWHMWTQAWLDGAWWDFDAVLPRERFHAGYVLVSTSSLSDDHRYAGLDAFIQLLGNIEIEVIDVTHR